MPEYFSEDFLLVNKSYIVYMFTPKRLLKELVWRHNVDWLDYNVLKLVTVLAV